LGLSARGLRFARDDRELSFRLVAANSSSSRLTFWAADSRFLAGVRDLAGVRFLAGEARFLAELFRARFLGVTPLGRLGRFLAGLLVARLGGFLAGLGIGLGGLLGDFLGFRVLLVAPCFLELVDFVDFLRRFDDETFFLAIAR
jgi:hypothetical protein